MIYSTHQELTRYRGVSKNLDTAIDCIQGGRLENLTLGKNPVDRDEVYIMCFEYDTIPASQGFFEAHMRYADIHIVLEGQESIGVTSTSDLQEVERKEEDDFIKLEGSTRVLCPLAPGEALIVYPEDAHMVKLQTNDHCSVRKAVVKLKV